MATKTVKARLLLKTLTAAEWLEQNPVLLKGEAGVESDTRHWKTGDGTTAWKDLPYRSEGLEVSTAAPTATDGIPGTFHYDQTANKFYVLLNKKAGNAWEQLWPATWRNSEPGTCSPRYMRSQPVPALPPER